ncbi:MAG TPA: hypothetical protein VM934_06315 [Pyrinomonadaceae bacterium]|nr:hypothetical protein [Pyrinomonadaceae bacterium]
MLSRKRPFVILGLLLLALSAFVYTSPQASPQNNRRQQPTPTPQRPPTLTLDSDAQVVTLCPDAESMANPRVRLKANGFSPDGNPLRYRWTVSGGRLEGDGTEVVWDLTGAQPGVYSANVTLESGPTGGDPLCTAFTSTKVVVRNCPPPRPVCPNVSMSCPDVASPGSPVTFTASIGGGTPGVTPVYNWAVSAGTITAGQGSPTITVDTTGLGGQPIRATVSVEGYNLECRASCQTSVPAPVQPRKTDEFGEIARDDEKARLDLFAIELQNEPGAQGYVIGYGGRRPRFGDGQRRADRARDYLVNTRGIDASRIVTLNGGFRESGTTELWIVPPGATPPRAR